MRKADYSRLDYYDVWLPELAPSAKLVKLAQSGDWQRFEKSYRREMRAQSNLIEALAVLSRDAEFALGCYCENEVRCHRSILRDLLREHGARIR